MGNPVAIPFELVLNHIILNVKINQINKIKLVLDTGLPIGGVILFKNEKSDKLDLKYSGQTYIGWCRRKSCTGRHRLRCSS